MNDQRIADIRRRFERGEAHAPEDLEWLLEENDHLRAANAKLRAELAWYADRERYRHPDGDTYGEAHELIHYDLGRRARAALDAEPEKKEG